MNFWQQLSSAVSTKIAKFEKNLNESKFKKIFEEAASRLRVLAEPTEDQISARAYQLWEEAGKPIGNDQEFWNKAKEELTKSGVV